jgi:hypothetical protein
MWYITALIRQEFPQGLVPITWLIDDGLPLAILSKTTGQHPLNTPGVSYLLFHALHFSSPVINPMFFLLSSSFSSSKCILTVIFACAAWIEYQIWGLVFEFNSVHMWDTPVVITSNFGFEYFI